MTSKPPSQLPYPFISQDSKRLELDRRFCVAPMMEWTDRHYRYFARLISKKTVLYSEMVTTGALLFGDKQRHLHFNEEEHPVALQLGGSRPAELAKCAKLAELYGYDEINLNVGCPSDRVQNNMIGACLMAHPELVSSCISDMKSATSLPVTVKHRIGIDDYDSLEFLFEFVDKIKSSGCTTFIVHARKAILKGLSPKQNRDIPPLLYDRVYLLKKEFPELEIIINGGVNSLEQSVEFLSSVDGVMIGREAYHNPYILAGVDSMIYQQAGESIVRHEVAKAMIPYIQLQLAMGVRLHSITRHMLGLFHGIKGARAWRRHLSEQGPKAGADEGVVLQALELVQV